ncbi:SsrA-binding protein SmpB [Candidatus Dojkabacteria bacterium]|uniref:SsrA-binding protein n=1 Tax=Candidatus Dojkabacteria bacterium TaxID=2099670 RepID=A0A955L5Y3_9BACT|nr:SsrA-binding protein SmpB [Candidatus Dojkabacteria bacterium]
MKTLARNKKALFNYELLDQYEAGIVLQGWEVKSIKGGNISLKESFIAVENEELYLVNAHVSIWPGVKITDESMFTRPRKLLLNTKEIAKLLRGRNTTGNTIVPIDMHLSRGKVKVNIALVRGKKKYDKRESLKEKDVKRQIQSDLKNYK